MNDRGADPAAVAAGRATPLSGFNPNPFLSETLDEKGIDGPFSEQ